jgi:hypothetical protein
VSKVRVFSDGWARRVLRRVARKGLCCEGSLAGARKEKVKLWRCGRRESRREKVVEGTEECSRMGRLSVRSEVKRPSTEYRCSRLVKSVGFHKSFFMSSY